MDTPKVLEGDGQARPGNGRTLDVNYRVVVHYKGQPPRLTKIDASITGPPEAVNALAGADATLRLKDGQELDGLCNSDGRFSLGNYGNAIRGDLI
jgi:hypothetical protein